MSDEATMMAKRVSSGVFKKWYLYLTASIYAVVCGIRAGQYIYLDLRTADVSIPVVVQALCGLAAIAGIVFFLKPRIGHHGLVVVACAGLYLAARDGNVKAAIFHMMVLAVLSLPAVTLLRSHRGKPAL